MKGEKKKEDLSSWHQHNEKVMAIAVRKSEGAWGYGPNERGPHSQGGDNTTSWEKLLPTFNFSFRADSSKPLSAVQTPPIHACCCKSFFPFFPFHPNLSAVTSLPPLPHLALTHAISPQHHLDAATTTPTLWPLQPLPLPPFVGSQAPAGLALTHTTGTHKPPRCHHPHCA